MVFPIIKFCHICIKDGFHTILKELNIKKFTNNYMHMVRRNSVGEKLIQQNQVEELDLIIVNGFKPIAVTKFMLENTFVFETKDEAMKAYHFFERDENENWIGNIVGWWYGREDFIEAVKEYEAEFGYKLNVHWI